MLGSGGCFRGSYDGVLGADGSAVVGSSVRQDGGCFVVGASLGVGGAVLLGLVDALWLSSGNGFDGPGGSVVSSQW